MKRSNRRQLIVSTNRFSTIVSSQNRRKNNAASVMERLWKTFMTCLSLWLHQGLLYSVFMTLPSQRGRAESSHTPKLHNLSGVPTIWNPGLHLNLTVSLCLNPCSTISPFVGAESNCLQGPENKVQQYTHLLAKLRHIRKLPSSILWWWNRWGILYSGLVFI